MEKSIDKLKKIVSEIFASAALVNFSEMIDDGESGFEIVQNPNALRIHQIRITVPNDESRPFVINVIHKAISTSDFVKPKEAIKTKLIFSGTVPKNDAGVEQWGFIRLLLQNIDSFIL